jgi:hypothetical protein
LHLHQHTALAASFERYDRLAPNITGHQSLVVVVVLKARAFLM